MGRKLRGKQETLVVKVEENEKKNRRESEKVNGMIGKRTSGQTEKEG